VAFKLVKALCKQSKKHLITISMIKRVHQNLVILLVIFIAASSGCTKEDLTTNSTEATEQAPTQSMNAHKKNYSGEVAARWFDLELQLIKTTQGFTPPVASRALGYTGVALYESLVPGMGSYVSLKSKLGFTYSLPATDESTNYYWPAVANAALKSIISRMFPTTHVNNKSAINNLYNEWLMAFTNEIHNEDLDQSVAYGEAVANIIFEWSKTDGGHESYSNNTPAYTLPLFPGAWVPTAPAFQNIPVQAFWGSNRPFLTKNVDANCIPPPPPAYSISHQSEFYKQAVEVYNTGIQLTDAQKTIALFWADGGGTITPPGHNVNLATQTIRSRRLSLNEAAGVYAKVGIGVADAFIACWKGKYKYNLMRPITYIQQNINPTWTSFIVTPPFPAYASGHATVSGATAEILSYIFGDKVAFQDRTHEQLYGIRNYASFYDAAEEAAVSRLYGGIHFRIDNNEGLEKGKRIGKNITAINLKKS
jgi:membrane-associated phospholipid phosphatase